MQSPVVQEEANRAKRLPCGDGRQDGVPQLGEPTQGRQVYPLQVLRASEVEELN